METEWTGMTEIAVGSAEVDRFYNQGMLDFAEVRDLPCHTGVVLIGGNASALGRVTPGKDSG